MHNLERLQSLLEQHFNLSELAALAFKLKVEWENIHGETRQEKSRNLLEYLQRRKQLPFLIETLQAVRPSINWLETASDDAPCPYRGLHAFREEDEHLFFGRSALTDRLLTTSRNKNFVAVLGSSGSGKSSVVMAGLVPRLRQENRWLVATFRPGTQPFRALARTLLPLLYPYHSKLDLMEEEEKLVNRLHQKPGSLQQVIEWILREHEPNTRLLLIVDQFEELYTLGTDRDLRHAFLNQLLAITVSANVTARPKHLLLLTLRSDFLGQFQNDHVPFVEAAQSGLFLMTSMDQEDMREAIKYPALNAGVEFDDTLVERILDDVQHSEQLPLLEFALSLLWQRRENGIISHAAYEDIGRVKGALAQYADEVYTQLTEAQQEQARFIFLKLVQPGEGTEDTRRVAQKAEIGDKRWPLVNQLADARLIVTGQNEMGEETVEVIHEALIWGWQQLQGWVNNDRQFLTWHKQLRHDYYQWREGDQDEGDLLRGTSLQKAIIWLKERSADLTKQEEHFIQVSIDVRLRDQRDLLIAKIKRGDGQGQNLYSAPLMGANLSQANLAQTILTKSNLSNADLSNSSLCEANLCEANLRGANLKLADLRGANLWGADLYGAYLLGTKIDDNTKIEETWLAIWEIVNRGAQGKILRQADLRGADLRGAKLKKADLTKANLEGANLAEAELQDAILFGANLRETNLSGLDLSEINFSGLDLSRANLNGAKLRGAILTDTNLSGTILSDLDMSGADLHGANLTKATLGGTDLSDADLSEADLTEASLRGAKLVGTNLRKAKLKGVDLQDADLSGVDLQETDLRGAILREAHFHETILSGLDLSESDLSGANLQRANLTKANLKGAFLWTANLREADLTGADLRMADLRVADLRDTKMEGADLRGADLRLAFLITNLMEVKYDTETKWPKRYAPQAVRKISKK